MLFAHPIATLVHLQLFVLDASMDTIWTVPVTAKIAIMETITSYYAVEQMENNILNALMILQEPTQLTKTFTI